jgi:peroxiredoxin Q/BCP
VIGVKPVVLYFYPKDDTAGCTAQACSFRDQYEDFKDLGAEVIGISSDSVTSHQKFATQHQLPFILLSDSDKKLRKLFGVPSGLLGLIPGRVTYVADKNGIIKLIFDSMMPTNHISNALKAVKKMS